MGGPRIVHWLKAWSCNKWFQLDTGDLEMIPLYPVKTRYKLVPLYSLLSAGKAREMGTKGVPAEIQKPEAVTAKAADLTTLDLLINKTVLPLERVVAVVVVNQTTIPDNPSLLKISV